MESSNDEERVSRISETISSSLFFITHIFSDQMDRVGEIYTIPNMILDAIRKKFPMILFFNGDTVNFYKSQLFQTL